MTDIEKCIAFIRKNAKPKQVTTRVRFVLPDNFVKTVLDQIESNDGAFSVEIAAFNKSIGWGEKSVRADFLKEKLNASGLVPEGKIIHVGTAQKNTYYNFELLDAPEDNSDTDSTDIDTPDSTGD